MPYRFSIEKLSDKASLDLKDSTTEYNHKWIDGLGYISEETCKMHLERIKGALTETGTQETTLDIGKQIFHVNFLYNDEAIYCSFKGVNNRRFMESIIDLKNPFKPIINHRDRIKAAISPYQYITGRSFSPRLNKETCNNKKINQYTYLEFENITAYLNLTLSSAIHYHDTPIALVRALDYYSFMNSDHPKTEQELSAHEQRKKFIRTHRIYMYSLESETAEIKSSRDEALSFGNDNSLTPECFITDLYEKIQQSGYGFEGVFSSGESEEHIWHSLGACTSLI